MNKQLKWIIGFMLVFLFVSMNLYLTKHDFTSIARTSLVHDQTKVKTENLQKTMMKNGVIHTATEQHLYFSEQLGMFSKFLVEEGQTITAGTPLYEYTVVDLEEQRLLFESESEQLASEISAVESYLTELESLESQLTTATSNGTTTDSRPTSTLDDEELAVTIELEVGIDVSDSTIDQTRSMLNQKIGEQEAEVSRLEAQEAKYERLIAGLEESPTVTVESDVDGKIAHLEADTENPLITVYANNLTSRSLLTDEEARIVIAGLKAKVTSPVAGSTVDGAVVANPQLPAEEPKIGEKSQYPIDIDLEDAGEEWFIGQQVVNEIVTDEVLDATTVPILSVENKKRVYALSPTGFIEQRQTKLGLRAEDRQEVYENLEEDEWIVKDPDQVERYYSPYITPLNMSRIHFDNWDYLDKRTNWKYVLLGAIPK